MREIPPLQVLCLRAIGSHACSAEVTFARTETGQPSAASRLLRSFHRRPITTGSSLTTTISASLSVFDQKDTELESSIRYIPMTRTACLGKGTFRRIHANEVDLNHPIVGAYHVTSDPSTNNKASKVLVMEFSSAALDCLQSYIDALVELGRMDDSRLGVHFFEEWRTNVELSSSSSSLPSLEKPPPLAASSKKRRRSGDNAPLVPSSPPAAGSLSLHNGTLSTDTMEAMVKAGIGPNLAVLDLTGVHGLTDAMTSPLLSTCTQLQRLSIKNCRRITSLTLQALVTGTTTPLGVAASASRTLTCLDVGGSFNISAPDVLRVLPKFHALQELHASGLGWTDALVSKLVQIRAWKALSLGFGQPQQLSHASLRENLMMVADTLTSLALPFCETVVDNTLLGILGRNLPHLFYMDLRGNPSLSTLTGWFDGRVSADLPAQALTVLGRYSGLSESSIEETRRIHPLEATELVVILDSGGAGAGIDRVLAG